MADGGGTQPLVYQSSTGARWSVRPVHHTLLEDRQGAILRIQEIPKLAGRYVAVRPPTDVHTFAIPLRPPPHPAMIVFGGRKQLYRGGPGECTVMPASADSVWHCGGGGERTLLASFAAPWLRDLGLDHDLPQADREPEGRVGYVAPELAALAMLLRRAHADGTATSGFAEHWSVLAALALLRFPLDLAGPPRGGVLAVARLRRVLDFIEVNLEGDVSLVTLARVAGLSAFHFARGFRATVGLAPHVYVTRRRIERAQALMRRGGMDLAEVGLAAGFASQSHFTTAFRRATGTTPGRWRKAALGDAGN